MIRIAYLMLWGQIGKPSLSNSLRRNIKNWGGGRGTQRPYNLLIFSCCTKYLKRPQIHFWFIPKRIECRDSDRFARIARTAALFTTAKRWKWRMCPSTDEWMTTCAIYVWYTALKKKENSDMWYNMDALWRHYTKWSNPDTKGQKFYDFTCTRYLVKFTETEWWLTGPKGKESYCLVGTEFQFGKMKTIRGWVLVTVQQCTKATELHT